MDNGVNENFLGPGVAGQTHGTRGPITGAQSDHGQRPGVQQREARHAQPNGGIPDPNLPGPSNDQVLPPAYNQL